MAKKGNSKFVKQNPASAHITDTPLSQSLSTPGPQISSDIAPDSESNVFPPHKETEPIQTHSKRNRSQSYSSYTQSPKDLIAAVKENQKSNKNKFSSSKSSNTESNDEFKSAEEKHRSTSYQVLPQSQVKLKLAKQQKLPSTSMNSVISQVLMSSDPKKMADRLLESNHYKYVGVLAELSDSLRNFLSNLEQTRTLTRVNSLASYGSIGRSVIHGSLRSNGRVKTPLPRSGSAQSQNGDDEEEGNGTSGLNINDQTKEVSEFAHLLMEYYTETLSQVESLSTERDNMTNSITELQRDREKLQKQVHLIQDQSENHENENLQLQQTREELLTENRDLINHNAQRELRIKDQENKLLENKEQILQLKANLADKDKEFHKMKVRLESEIKAIRARITEFQTQKGELEKKLKQSQEDNEIARNRIEVLLRELQESQSELNRSFIIENKEVNLESPSASPVISPQKNTDVELPQISALEEQYKARVEKLQKSREKAKAQINRFKKERLDLLKAIAKLQEKSMSQKQQIEILGGHSDDDDDSDGGWDLNRKYDPKSIPISPLESDEESEISNDGFETPTESHHPSLSTKPSHPRLKTKSRQAITPPDVSESEESDAAGPKMNPHIGSRAFNRSLFRKKNSVNDQSLTLSQVLNGGVQSPKPSANFPMNAYYQPEEKSTPNSPQSAEDGTLLSDYLTAKDVAQPSEKLSDLVDTSLNKVLPKFNIRPLSTLEKTPPKSNSSQEHISVEPHQNMYRSESDYSTDFEGSSYYKVDPRLAADIETLTFQIISRLSPLLNKTEHPSLSKLPNFSAENEQQSSKDPSNLTSKELVKTSSIQSEDPQLSSDLQRSISQISQENINTIKHIIHSSSVQEKANIINIIKLIQPIHVDNETIANLFDLKISEIGLTGQPSSNLDNEKSSEIIQSSTLKESEKELLSISDHNTSKFTVSDLGSDNKNTTLQQKPVEDKTTDSTGITSQTVPELSVQSLRSDISKVSQDPTSLLPESNITLGLKSSKKDIPVPISTDEIVDFIQTDSEFQKNFVSSLSKLITIASSKVESNIERNLTTEDEKSIRTVGLIYEIFHSSSAQKVLNNYNIYKSPNSSSQEDISKVLEPSISSPSSDQLHNILQEIEEASLPAAKQSSSQPCQEKDIDKPSSISPNAISLTAGTSSSQTHQETEIDSDLSVTSPDQVVHNVSSALGLLQPSPVSQSTPPHPSQPLPPTPHLNSIKENNETNESIETSQTHSTASTSPQIYGKLLELSSSKYVPLAGQNTSRNITPTSPLLSGLTQSRNSSIISPSISGDLDEAVILYSLTQTMVGEMMHKFVKYESTRGHTTKCHQRFIWVHPYTKTINWSPYAPGPGQQTDMLGQTMHRSVYFKSIKVVKDPPEAIPPGACRYSIIIDTGKAKYKFKASSKTRHDIWFTSLNFIQKHIPSRLDVTPASVNFHGNQQAPSLLRSNTSERPISPLSKRLSQHSTIEGMTDSNLDRPQSSLSVRSNISRPQSPARSLVSRGTHTLSKMLSKTSLNSLHFGSQSSDGSRQSRRDHISQA